MIRLGICTRYFHHESTYAALRIARWIEDQGGSVTILPTQMPVMRMDPHFDEAITSPLACTFKEWAEHPKSKFDAILWTDVPLRAELAWAVEHNVPTFVLPLWSEIDAEDYPILMAVRAVLCPLGVIARHLRARGIPHAVPVPWDCGEPLVKRCSLPEAGAGLRILMPLYDGVAKRIEGTALSLFCRLLSRFPDVVGTIAYTSSTIAPYALRRIRAYQKAYPDKLLSLSLVAPMYRPLLTQVHDLVLWPTLAENTCMVGLSAAAAGAPVVAFALPQTQECFTEDNAVLIPCPLGVDCEGVPMVMHADYTAMETACIRLLADRPRLAAMQQTVLNGLHARREAFDNALMDVFGAV